MSLRRRHRATVDEEVGEAVGASVATSQRPHRKTRQEKVGLWAPCALGFAFAVFDGLI
jgi:hypothetical protein